VPRLSGIPVGVFPDAANSSDQYREQKQCP
jgi:hypothetical protein